MEILLTIIGSTGLLLLIFMVITWNLGVRMKLDCGFGVINSAIFFLFSLISIFLFNVNHLYSWLFILGGFIVSTISYYIYSLGIPIISSLIKFIPSLWATLLRIGISKEKIKNVQQQSNASLIKEWSNRQKVN